MLKWNTDIANSNKKIISDRFTNDIYIREEDLLYMIKLVNRGQQDRRVRLIEKGNDDILNHISCSKTDRKRIFNIKE